MRRDDLIRILRAHAAELAQRGVLSLLLFGSVARDEAHPDSDVDLLVELDLPSSFDRFMDLKLYLEDVLQRRVDLVSAHALRAALRPAVEREAVRVA
ncbi:MAG: nucleotidyltransferase family protein [Deltaproteobacteria bacterium]|nr:nucleotidyltransferase family protein [Deltaproteobacteria bacterium]